MSDRPKDRQKGMDTLFPKRDAHSCRVCNEYVEDGRRNYCCPRCKRIAKAVQRMFVWDCVREAVLERDDYTCQQCGLSKEQAERAYWQTHDLAKERSDSTDEFWRRWRAYGVTDFQIFEVDHIERVADGGHPFDETNLQTLCKFCHRAKTAAENRTNEPTIEDRPEVGLDAYLDTATDGGEEGQ
ncbi:HNH endonuclease [Halorubrum lacusprofundi]|jgi:5-methylcytosine-specific restriction endonuclease McrA|uniref:HNH endonuclease n=1 Tax=Halorubrum lacusprofundi TaxID=2247 RepID=A0A220SWV8_9EURY|nr:HNH endonuclease [Halorubrum lacusprofundi]ASK38179.1 HNH endonuclease [Halorubrum lacusprofundi]